MLTDSPALYLHGPVFKDLNSLHSDQGSAIQAACARKTGFFINTLACNFETAN
jgi:hypothetical protein